MTMIRLVEGAPDFLAKLDEKRRALKAEAIRRNGWSESISCPGCGDTGVMPGTGAALRYCGCEVGEEKRLLHSRAESWDARMPRRVREFRLDTAPDQEAAKKVRRWLALGPWETGQNLVLVGPPGTGKTGLGVGALHVVHMAGKSAAMVNVVEWLDLMRPTDDPTRASEAERLTRAAQGATVLLFDDLGADKPSQWVRERVYAVVNRRYEQGRPTIVTTNLTRAELSDSYGERTIDRLFETASGIAMAGQNLRRIPR